MVKERIRIYAYPSQNPWFSAGFFKDIGRITTGYIDSLQPGYNLVTTSLHIAYILGKTLLPAAFRGKAVTVTERSPSQNCKRLIVNGKWKRGG